MLNKSLMVGFKIYHTLNITSHVFKKIKMFKMTIDCQHFNIKSRWKMQILKYTDIQKLEILQIAKK